MKNEFLTVPFETKEVDEEGVIEGFASTFGNVDLGSDVVDKGAFKKTLRESKGKFPILSSHNPTKQIGWNLEAHETDDGLFVRGQLDIKNNQKAREHHSLIRTALKIKAKAGLSIGYIPIKVKEDVIDDIPVRRLKELKLLEYSPVSFPMNTLALATAAKNWEEGSLEQGVKFFIDSMLTRGYSKVEIFKTLTRAVKPVNDPSPVAQSFQKELDKFLKTMGV